MSTLEREVVDTGAPLPSTSMALVPLAGDRAPQKEAGAGGGMPRNLHRWFYGLGYAALGLIALGAWMEPRGGDAAVVLFGTAMPFLGIAGLGVLVHVAYKPSVRKLRMGLGAIASLVLAVAATGPIGKASREVHTLSRITRLQPLADDLARDARIHSLAIPNEGWVELNGWQGSLDGTGVPVVDGRTTTLAEVLQRDGISRLDLVRLLRRMREAGVWRVETGEEYLAFQSRGIDPGLLYLRPGQPLPPPGTTILDRPGWRTQPMGGGWYLQLYARRWD